MSRPEIRSSRRWRAAPVRRRGQPACAPLQRLLVLVTLVLLAACGDGVNAPHNPELSRELEPHWAPILAANKITTVHFDGRELVVEHGVNAAVHTEVDRQSLPNYSSDPLPFTIRVQRGPSGAKLKFYADLSNTAYRPYLVERDVEAVLHQAMTAYLRRMNVLERG